jgi:DNA-binding PadR family transcriptional regulator
MVKKVLEPVILSFFQKPVSGNDILNGISERYNVSVPKARVYTQLYALKKKGYLSMTIEGKSKVYSPTENGKIYIEQKLHEFNSVFHHILSEVVNRNAGIRVRDRKE